MSINRIAVIVALLFGGGFGIYKLSTQMSGDNVSTEDVATYTVYRRTIEDRIVERGTIESQKTVFGKCQVPGRNKITFIVPEGTKVKKGEKVAEFETKETESEIQQKLVEVNTAKGALAEAMQALEIQRFKNETDISTAQLEYELAVIDLEKYEKGTFVAEKTDLERAIKEAEAELKKIQEEKRNIEKLVKKGYRTPQQLDEYRLREMTYKFQVERDEQKLMVLKDYEYKRQMTEFAAKAVDTKRALSRAKKSAEAEEKKAEATVAAAENGVKILEKQLNEVKELLAKCTLYAEQDGTVAYANERWYDASDRIREGTEVYSGRNVYFLPDMSRMQVKANVHESVVDRIEVDQKANIRLDAFSDTKLYGTVSSVAGMASSSYSNVQNYDTIIKIDDLPEDLAIKPGMTAEVDLLVGVFEDVLAVPVGAITEHFGQTYVYAKSGNEFERRKVNTDRTTHSFVEITAGIEEGDVVALDAYQRGLADFAEAEREASGSNDEPAEVDAPGAST